MINEKKDTIQSKALEAWMVDKRGTLLMGTGIGKTRVGVLASNQLLKEGTVGAVYIVVPTTNLILGWIAEFIKWGMEEILDHVEIQCIQTAYKANASDTSHPGLVGTEATNMLLIADEVHSTLSPQYRSLYNRDWKHILGLTATLPPEPTYIEILNQYAPPIFEYTLEQGVEDKLISPYEIYNLALPFTAKERAKYNIFDRQFNSARATLSREYRKEGYDSVFDMARDLNKTNDFAKKFWGGMTMRKHVCFNASTKIDACIKIIEKYPEKKWIVFSKTKKFTDELNTKLVEKGIKSVRYHSGMSAGDRRDSLDSANSDTTRVICSATALNTGYNLPSIDAAIVASGVSTQLANIQQIGRTVRLQRGKRAIVINLYIDKTQERKWCENKLGNMECNWIDSITKLP